MWIVQVWERRSVRNPFHKEVGVGSKGNPQMTVLVVLMLDYRSSMGKEIKALSHAAFLRSLPTRWGHFPSQHL